jgi:hypothetical protein
MNAPDFLSRAARRIVASFAVLAVALVGLLGARTARAQLQTATATTTTASTTQCTGVSSGFSVTLAYDNRIAPDGGWPLGINPETNRTWINRYDCEQQFLLTFDYAGTGATPEFWVGPAGVDCSQYATGQTIETTTSICINLTASVQGTSTGQFTVPANLIASGTPSFKTCDSDTTGDPPLEVDLWVIYPGGTSGCIATQVDLQGPPAITLGAAAPGNQTLNIPVSNDPLSTSVLGGNSPAGYLVYCAPGVATGNGVASSVGSGGAGGASGAGGAGGAGGAAAGGDPPSVTDASDGGSTDASDAASDAATDAATDAGTDAATDGGDSGASAQCNWLGAGPPLTEAGAPQYPDPGMVCISYIQSPLGSSIVLTTDANGKPLIDGKSYAVGVAAFDEMGNVGPMSNLACGVPIPTDTFLKVLCDDMNAEGSQCSGCRICNDSSSYDLMGNVLGWGALGVAGLVVRRRMARKTPRRRRGAGGKQAGDPSGTALE